MGCEMSHQGDRTHRQTHSIHTHKNKGVIVSLFRPACVHKKKNNSSIKHTVTKVFSHFPKIVVLILRISLLVPMATTQVDNVALWCQASCALATTRGTPAPTKPHRVPPAVPKPWVAVLHFVHIYLAHILSGSQVALQLYIT